MIVKKYTDEITYQISILQNQIDEFKTITNAKSIRDDGKMSSLLVLKMQDLRAALRKVSNTFGDAIEIISKI